MASVMQIDVAELAGIAAEGPLFGIFLVLDIAAIYILVGRRRHSHLNIPMTLAAVTMMALSFAQFIVDTVNVFEAFISRNRPERIAFLEDLTEPLFAAKHAIYFTMLFVGDAIVIYRAFVMWNKNILVVIIPILCSLGSTACAYQTIWAIRHFSFSTTFIRLEHNMGFAVFGLSFGANFIATALLAYKIWKADQELKQTTSISSAMRMSRLPIIRIIVESGAVNTAYLLIYTVILQSGSNGIEVVACIVTPLVGIIFSSIIIRAALAAEMQARADAHSSSSGIAAPMSFARNISDSSQNVTIAGSDGMIKLGREKKQGDSFGTESV